MKHAIKNERDGLNKFKQFYKLIDFFGS